MKKMPVGCLSGENTMPRKADMEVVVTSSVLNAADQFAFMQQTLLLQIFRVGDRVLPSPQRNGSPNSLSSSGSSSGVSMSNGKVNDCPTCAPFTDHCCQNENGLNLFQDFKLANSNCYWDQKLADGINGLRYL